MRNVSDKFYQTKLEPYCAEITKCIKSGYTIEEIADYLEVSAMSLKRARDFRSEFKKLWKDKPTRATRPKYEPVYKSKQKIIVDIKKQQSSSPLLKGILSFMKMIVEEYDTPDSTKATTTSKEEILVRLDKLEVHCKVQSQLSAKFIEEREIIHHITEKVNSRISTNEASHAKDIKAFRKVFLKLEQNITTLEARFDKMSTDTKKIFKKYWKTLDQRVEVLEEEFHLQQQVDGYIKQEMNEK